MAGEVAGDVRGAAVAVDTEDVDRGAAVHEGADLAFAGAGDDRHRGVVGVDGLHKAGDALDFGEEPARVAFQGDLVAEPPHQQGGVVFVLTHNAADLVELGTDLLRVVVVEAVALVAEPDAEGDLDASLVGGVEYLLGVVGAPRADGVAARGDELVEVALAARALHEEGLAIYEKLVAIGPFDEPDGAGVRVGDKQHDGDEQRDDACGSDEHLELLACGMFDRAAVRCKRFSPDTLSAIRGRGADPTARADPAKE